jgi:hypothetical protein
METNRIKFYDQNESAYLPGGATTIQGFTVVKAPRGNAEPVLFPRASELALKAVFGSPSNKYPDIQEAIEFNKEFSLYVSAPPGVIAGNSNYVGGMYLTTEGSLEKFYKVSDPKSPNFDIEVTGGFTGSAFSMGSVKNDYFVDIPNNTGIVGISNINKAYFNLNKVSHIYFEYGPFDNTPKDIVEMTIVPTITGADIIETIGDDDFTVGTIVDNETDYEIFLTGAAGASFDLSTIIEGGLGQLLSVEGDYDTVNVKWIYNIEEYVVQTFYQSSPRSSSTKFTISSIDVKNLTDDGDPNPYYNSLRFSFTETQDGIPEYTSGTYIVSPNPLAKDGYNQSLYIEDVLDTKALWYIGSKVYMNLTDIVSAYVTPVSNTVSGVRLIESTSPLFTDDTHLGPTLLEGWAEANDPLYQEVNILFDNSGVAEIKGTHASLRNSILKTSTFLSPLKVTATETATAVTNIIAARATAPKTLGGLGFTCNEFLIRDATGKEYYSAIMGSVALNYARIMNLKLGGAAPMFTNDGLNLGGQLSRAVRKQKYKFLPDNLDSLDAAGINPIILDNFYGLMLTSQKTAASPAFLTDWSFFGHSMAFDMLKAEIKRDILIPQLGKALSDYYYELRQSQCETIVNRRLSGPTAIWTDAKVLINDSTVNNDETRMQNKFVVKVRVKVTPFTEYVDFILNNVDQKTNL